MQIQSNRNRNEKNQNNRDELAPTRLIKPDVAHRGTFVLLFRA
jgi:hypothetical protein